MGIPGDIGGSAWVRYDDEGEKAYKMGVERQNGRGAMLGITGCLIHELLRVVPLVRLDANAGAQCKQTLDGCIVLRVEPRVEGCVCVGDAWRIDGQVALCSV